MSYSSSNFIQAYNSTDRIIQIQNSLLQKVFSINVCNENKIYVSNNLLIIILEDNNPQKQYNLDFSSNTEANTAFVSLKSAIDTLHINCLPTTRTPPSPSSTPIAITYVQYQSQQQAGTLIALQWYDVSDTTNLLNLNTATLRLLAKSVDDYEPSGVIVAAKILITINTLDNSIQRYEFASQKILSLNKSSITYDINSKFISAYTNSTITAASSTNVEANNNSTLNVSGCNLVKAINGTNVKLLNATNVDIDNIQQDLTTIGFNLVSVKLDQINSIGKEGRNSNVNITTNQTLLAYRDYTDQVFNYTTNSNTIIVTLDNKILQANGTFRLKYMGTGTGNTITVEDLSANVLYVLNDTVKNCWAVFKFNKNTNLFEFINLDLSGTSTHTVHQTNPTVNGQTVFNLPVPATVPSELEMFVNGNKLRFGYDFTYASPNIVTFQNAMYLLETTDNIEFNIY